MGVRKGQPSGQIMYGPGRSESMFDHITSRMRETIILIIWKNKSSILNISAVVLFCNFQDLKFILKGIIPILVRSFVTGGEISKVFCNIIYRRKHRVFVWSLNGFFIVSKCTTPNEFQFNMKKFGRVEFALCDHAAIVIRYQRSIQFPTD